MPLLTDDPGIGRMLPFAFGLNAQQSVKVRMRVSGGGPGMGQFYWTTYADQWEDELKVLYFAVQGDDAWHEYSIPVGQHARWNGQIRTIRLDPVHGGQYVGHAVDIDWIRLMEVPPPGTETPTPTPTTTPTGTETPTGTVTVTPTSTGTPTSSPSPTATATATLTARMRLFLPVLLKTLRIVSDRQASVDAHREWQDIAIPLLAGDEIQITYLSGTWSIWPGVDPYTDAEGQPGRRDSCTLLPSANTGGLIARSNGGPPHFIGNAGRFVAATSGNLELSMNDCLGHFYDNGGQIAVWITVKQAVERPRTQFVPLLPAQTGSERPQRKAIALAVHHKSQFGSA